jgi:PPM family protein phosphatase
LRVSALSDVGLVRKNNEDSFSICAPRLFMVADGMGGHEAGEVASKITVTAIYEYVLKYETEQRAEVLLRDAIQDANRQVYETAVARPECSGMGTTVSVVLLSDGLIHWAHVGDSRIYLFREGEHQLLTDDHSVVWQLLKQGGLTPREAEVHPQRNMLTRAVGTEAQIEIDVGSTPFLSGDQLLLCTDGLTNLVSGEELAQVTKRMTDTDEAVKYLVNQAKERGGFDNITVILIDNR